MDKNDLTVLKTIEAKNPGLVLPQELQPILVLVSGTTAHLRRPSSLLSARDNHDVTSHHAE